MTAACQAGRLLRRMRSHFNYVCALNLICALIITFVGNAGSFFLKNLLASFCIGTLAYLLIDGGRLLLWGEATRPNWPGLLILIAVAVPTAQIGGTFLFDSLMGNRTVSLRDLASPKQLSLLIVTLMAAGAIVRGPHLNTLPLTMCSSRSAKQG